MKNTILGSLLAVGYFAFSIFTAAEDRRPDKTVLVIMTFNAEFLWDGVNPEEGASNVTFPWKGSQTEAEEHMSKVADVVIQSNPDVINLVEVENLDALTTFNTKFLSGRGYRPYLVNGTDTQTGQDVALLTRIDPENDAIARDDREGQSGTVKKSVSKNYIAKITAGTTKLAFIGAHLRARPNQQNLKETREAQADALRSMAIDLRSAGFLPIVLGDLNDFDGNLDSKDHIDSTPITMVLSLLRAMDPQSSSDNLINAASFVPKANRFTAFFDRNDDNLINPLDEFTSIDHVLLSPEVAAKVTSVDFPHNHDPRQVSDHFPIVVRLKLQEGPSPDGTLAVRIESLLPNPPGNENQNEEVTLKNKGTTAVTLTGWKLRDLAKQTWTLDSLGTLNAGESKTIKRTGQSMALNNNGDTIDLLDPTSKVMHTVTYTAADEGEILTPAP